MIDDGTALEALEGPGALSSVAVPPAVALVLVLLMATVAAVVVLVAPLPRFRALDDDGRSLSAGRLPLSLSLAACFFLVFSAWGFLLCNDRIKVLVGSVLTIWLGGGAVS